VARAEVANGGVVCGAQLLCLLIMRRCGWRPVLVLIGHVGSEREEETNGKEQKLIFPCCVSRGRRKRNSAVSKRHRFIFILTHETASFFPKHAASFK